MNKREKRKPKIEFPAHRALKINPYELQSGMANTSMDAAVNAVNAFNSVGKETDPLGMWTGTPNSINERPVQDADDL